MQSFSFIPLMTSKKKIFEYFFFQNLTFRLPWQPIKINDLDKIHRVCRGLLQEYFCKTLSKYLHEIAINLNFHFSHCKSMEILSCHSNQSAWATATKNNIFVEAIVRNNSAKFQLYPPNSFWGADFLIFFFRKFTLYVAMATNQIQRFRQNSYES